MSVTIKDIAVLTGASVSTVSLVLNGKAAQGRISEELEKKIINAAHQLSYRPNMLARGLRKGVTSTIGFVISDISNAFIIKLARHVEKEAMKNGYRVFFASSDESDSKCIELIDTFLNIKMDGLILAPTEGIEAKVKQLCEQKFPFVLVDRYFPKIDTNYVVMNNWQSSYDAINYLIKKGRKRIATFAYNTGFFHLNERLNGYKAALKNNGLQIDKKQIINVPFAETETEVMKEHMKYLIEECHVDGVFFQTNRTALPGIKAIYELNYKIPEQIAVICFDDNEFFQLLNPPITSLLQPIEELGRESVRIIIDEIRNKKINSIKSRTIYSAKLIERNSC